MKIGILTYHSVYNFGANLQVLSTVEYLRNKKFEPIVINWIPESLEARYNRTTPILQADAHRRFIKNYLPCSEICRTDKDIAEVILNQNIEGLIIGSDAILQHSTFLSRISIKKRGIILKKKPESNVMFPNPFWGSFISELKKQIPIVIMSASSQNANYKYIKGRLRRKINISLSQFTLITVRDDWTRKMVKYLTNSDIEPHITPDPVFAYNQNVKEQYTKTEIIEKFNLSDKYILLSFRNQYAVTKDWLRSFQLIAEKNNLQCIAFTMPNGIVFEHPFLKVIETPLCPKEWYGLIKFSSGYVGENMHPIVVALHNSIPFYSFDSYGIVKYKYFVNEKSSKIYDILSIAGFLKNRINILGRGYTRPTPEEILFRMINFNYERCHLFSIQQHDKYSNMMKSITSIFSC